MIFCFRICCKNYYVKLKDGTFHNEGVCLIFFFLKKKIADPSFLKCTSHFLYTFLLVPGSHYSCDLFTRKSQNFLNFVWGSCRKVFWWVRQYLLVEWPSVSASCVPLLVLKPFPPWNTHLDFSFFLCRYSFTE